MNDNTGHWIQQYAEQNLRLQERISELEAQLKRAEAALETAHTAGYSDGYSDLRTVSLKPAQHYSPGWTP